VKHFCPIGTQNLASPHISLGFKRVGLREKSVVLAIGGQWIAALLATAKAAVLGVTAAGA
jgi:hypothetical protein